MEWKYLDNITFVAAMGPPSQGRQSVTMRYTRLTPNLQALQPDLRGALPAQLLVPHLQQHHGVVLHDKGQGHHEVSSVAARKDRQFHHTDL